MEFTGCNFREKLSHKKFDYKSLNFLLQIFNIWLQNHAKISIIDDNFIMNFQMIDFKIEQIFNGFNHSTSNIYKRTKTYFLLLANLFRARTPATNSLPKLWTLFTFLRQQPLNSLRPSHSHRYAMLQTHKLVLNWYLWRHSRFPESCRFIQVKL